LRAGGTDAARAASEETGKGHVSENGVTDDFVADDVRRRSEE
jgi:hypothetical protein